MKILEKAVEPYTQKATRYMIARKRTVHTASLPLTHPWSERNPLSSGTPLGEEEGCDFSFCTSLNHFFQQAPGPVSLLSDKRPQGFSGL